MNLIEVTASTLLVALILLGCLQATTGMLGNETVADSQRQAEWFADELLAEIASVPFELTAEDRAVALTSSLVRPGIAELTDYNGWVQSPPTRSDGSTQARLMQWSVRTNVSDIDPAAPDNLISVPPGETAVLRRVTIAMTDPAGNTFTRTHLISRFARSQGINEPVDSLGRVQWQIDGDTHQLNVPLSNVPGR